jgi:uncharacterized protein (TIGR00255 family)
MSVRSMTGFAQVRKTIPEGEILLTLKSVNHRGLDLHFHLPPELDALESRIRALLKDAVVRGHLQVHLTLTRTSAAGAAAPWNRALMDAYMRAFHEAAALYRIEGRPDLNAALAIPGVLASAAEEQETGEEVAQAVLESVAEAAAVLNVFREREGAAMAAEMRLRCETIAGLGARIETIREGAVFAFQKRLRERLAELLHGAGLDPQRLAQEAALLADRSDVAEELVRLRTHAAQLDTLLAGDGEVGKRLDFLLQEMNREANTILSKTGGLGDLGLTITDLALAAKSEIDKIREQSLNLE